MQILRSLFQGHRRIRTVIATVVALALVVAFGSVQIDGSSHVINSRLAVSINGSQAWYARPQIATSVADPKGIYVVTPDPPMNGYFTAVRVDVDSGKQMVTNIVFGSGSSFRLFTTASVHAETVGIHFQRPAVHLISFPEGKGPGVHCVDSVTGRLRVIHDGKLASRLLMTRNVFNSNSTAELLSQISSDPNGRWVALILHDRGGWRLNLFDNEARSYAK
jgi:hypothetical protein